MKKLIQDFIKSGEQEFKFQQMMPIRDIEDILKEIGFEDLELSGEETNGWQIDFWYTFQSSEYGVYELSGSLHYGDFQLIKQS